MRELSAGLASRISRDVTTLAQCVRIQRRDGVVLGFTTFDRNLVIAGVTYQARGALDPSAVISTVTLRGDNLDLLGAVDHAGITADDLLAGVYERALVDVFLVDWTDPPATVAADTVVWLVTAVIREVEVRDGQFVAELAGLGEALQTSPLDLYTPTCRVRRLGDAQCKVDVAPYTFSYNVLSITNERSFMHSGAAQPDGYFVWGILRWTGGPNAGRETVVKGYQGGVVELREAMPRPVAVGHTFHVTRGCDRQFATCRDVFGNVENFRGEPPHLLPGVDRLLKP